MKKLIVFLSIAIAASSMPAQASQPQPQNCLSYLAPAALIGGGLAAWTIVVRKKTPEKEAQQLIQNLKKEMNWRYADPIDELKAMTVLFCPQNIIRVVFTAPTIRWPRYGSNSEIFKAAVKERPDLKAHIITASVKESLNGLIEKSR